MTQERFSKGFRRFVRENISSVEQVRTLLLLREDPNELWTAESLSDELSSSKHSIGLRLGVLLKRRLIVEDEPERFRYRPDPNHDALVEELRMHFEVRPVSVINLIYSSSLQSFSDAFRIGGGDSDDG